MAQRQAKNGSSSHSAQATRSARSSLARSSTMSTVTPSGPTSLSTATAKSATTTSTFSTLITSSLTTSATSLSSSLSSITLPPHLKEIPDQYKQYFRPDCAIMSFIIGDSGCLYRSLAQYLYCDQNTFEDMRRGTNAFLANIFPKFYMEYVTWPIEVSVPERVDMIMFSAL